MRLEDFDAFKEQMRQLCAVYGRTFSTPMCQAYWRVLRPLPLEEFERTVGALLPRATSKALFPRPAELAGDSPLIEKPPVSGDQAFRDAEERCGRHLDQLRRERGDAWWRAHVAACRLDRILATTDLSSPIYDQALRERRAMGWGHSYGW